MAAFRRSTVGLSPDLRTSGPAGLEGPAVSIGGKIEADDHRHVALCAGQAMQSVLLLVILRWHSAREKERKAAHDVLAFFFCF